jgi:hypothetical protein
VAQDAFPRAAFDWRGSDGAAVIEERNTAVVDGEVEFSEREYGTWTKESMRNVVTNVPPHIESRPGRITG